jgi:hypothetical protein
MDDAYDDKVQKGIEHLQAAAHEVIRATRSMLDVAEGLVDDPQAVEGLVSTLASAAQSAAARFRPDATADDNDDDGGHVQSIKVS